MDRLEKAARALVDELDRMFEDGERGILFEREFRALRSALPPAPGGGEVGVPVAWAILNPKSVLPVIDRDEGLIRAQAVMPGDHVVPLYTHPTHAPLGELERAVVEALAGLLDGLDANADGRDGLSSDEWDTRVAKARRALDAHDDEAQDATLAFLLDVQHAGRWSKQAGIEPHHVVEAVSELAAKADALLAAHRAARTA